jgi:hypothetical protein
MAEKKQSDASFYRSMHHLRKGGLHKALHIPEDQNIPAERLASAKNSNNPHVKKMAIMADNMKHWG